MDALSGLFTLRSSRLDRDYSRLATYDIVRTFTNLQCDQKLRFSRALGCICTTNGYQHLKSCSDHFQMRPKTTKSFFVADASTGFFAGDRLGSMRHTLYHNALTSSGLLIQKAVLRTTVDSQKGTEAPANPMEIKRNPKIRPGELTLFIRVMDR